MRVPADLTAEIATLARDITAPITGFTLRTRDEILLHRAGSQGIRLYQDLARDGHAGAVLRKRRAAVVAREWTVDPASEAPQDERAALLTRAALGRIRFDRACAGLLAAVLTGYAVAEVLWEAATLELEDGSTGTFVVPADIRVRNARRFVLSADEQLRLLTWDAPVDGIALPERKFLLVRWWAEENEDPYGRGLGHDLFWPVYFKRNGVALWAALAEKFGQPFVYAEYPQGTTEADRLKLLAAMQDLARGGGLAVPQGTLVKFLEAGASTGGSGLHADLVQAMDDEISKIVLGETLSTEMGAVGARAASETHEGVRQELADADADWLSAELHDSLLTWITEINLPGARPPTVWRRAPEQQDLEQRTRIDEALHRLGFELDESYVHETYGPGYRRVTPAAPTRPGPAFPAFAEGGPEDPVEAITARLAEDAAGAQEAMLEAVRAEVAAAGTLPELEARLARLAGALPVRQLAETLGPAFALAYLAGADAVDSDRARRRVTIEALSLAPREAIAFFLQKGSVGTRRWDDVWQAGHARAFMVAGVQAGELLEGVREAVRKGIADGTTLATFRRDLAPMLERLGWQAKGKGYVAWRTRLVYETNLRSAYAAGDYEQRSEPETLDAFPYWRYRHSGAKDPRPEHVKWDGLVLRADDAWWQTHHPPNGWGCGCWVEPLSPGDLRRAGKDGPDSAPPIVTRQWTDRVSGRTERVPLGIDPGWDYNVGAAWREAKDLPPSPPSPVAPPPDWPPPPPPHAAVLPRAAPSAAPPAGVAPGDAWRLVEAPQGPPVAAGVMPGRVADSLGVTARTVLFSADTAAKQARNHPELTRQDYDRLFQVLSRPAVMLAQDDRRVLLLRSFGVLYLAAVKATADRAATYVVSYRRASEKDRRRLTRRFPELDREE